MPGDFAGECGDDETPVGDGDLREFATTSCGGLFSLCLNASNENGDNLPSAAEPFGSMIGSADMGAVNRGCKVNTE